MKYLEEKPEASSSSKKIRIAKENFDKENETGAEDETTKITDLNDYYNRFWNRFLSI